MNPHFRAINTLVLVETARQAEDIAQSLRTTGIAVQQSWVTTATEFGNALQRESFDLGIVHCRDALSHIPAAITRYPATPFLAVMDRHKNRVAEALLERGVSDVVGLSQPVRMRRVLQRLLSEASLRHDNERLRARQREQESMLHSVLQNTQQAVAYLHQGVHSYANAAYQSLTGLSELENVQQTPLLDLVHAQDQAQLREQMRQLEHGKRTYTSLNVTLVRPDGNTQAVALQMSESYFDDESVVQLVAHPVDDVVAKPEQRIDAELTDARPWLPIHQTEQASSSDDTLDATLAVVPLVPSKDAAFQWHKVNNLRAEIQQRILLSAPVPSTAQTDTSLDQQHHNRHLLNQALSWVQRHSGGRADTQVFVSLNPAAAVDTQLANWLSKQFTQLSVEPRALAVILPINHTDSTLWQPQALRLRALGVAISFSGVTNFQVMEALVQQKLVDIVFLNLSAVSSQSDLEQQVRHFRNAEVTTATTVRRAADIANVWRQGLDCFVDSSRPEMTSTSHGNF